MNASDRIWAEVAGLPSRKRKDRLLAMFQAYVDESEKDGLFVMAGYISTAERWAAFSDEWQRLLDYQSDHYRRLDAFHFKEMRSERDRERFPWFYRVAADHAYAAIALLLDAKALERVFHEFDWPPEAGGLELSRNPYVLAFHAVLTGIPRIQGEIGISTPIDFFFDDSSHKSKCLYGWDVIKEVAPKEILPLMGQPPAFRDDSVVLPLQAADLWAGMNREWGNKVLATGEVGGSYPWAQERMPPVISIFYDERRIRARYRVILEKMKSNIATGKYSRRDPF